MKPAAEDVLQKWPVSKRVNSGRASDDDASLIEQVPVISFDLVDRMHHIARAIENSE